MDIIYQFSTGANKKDNERWHELSIDQCCLKRISFAKDRSRITKKRHYHTGIEIHIIEKGYQEYEIDGERVKVCSGEFIAIRPRVEHTAEDLDPKTEKFAFCFRAEHGSALELELCAMPKYIHGNINTDVLSDIYSSYEEKKLSDRYSSAVISNTVWSCAVRWIRCLSATGTVPQATHESEGDLRVALAKQYVDDNIMLRISVPELASYCCISEKQLTRLFLNEEGITASEYIRKKRCETIEKMLTETEFSLAQISEKMGFGSEYYFNAFYKKYAGMTPGAYRRSMTREAELRRLYSK